MKKKIFTIGFIFLVLVNIAAIGRIGYNRIENYCKFKNTENCQSKHFLQQKLQLSENQTEEMQKLVQHLSKNIDSIKQSLTASQKELILSFHETEIDTSRLRKISEDIDVLQCNLKNQVIDYILEQKKILTPEQQTLFVDLLSQYLLPNENCHLPD
jgi:Spy/CpxP family protein refolding chaperone